MTTICILIHIVIGIHMIKTCSECGLSQLLEQYYKTKHGYASACKQCTLKSSEVRRRKNGILVRGSKLSKYAILIGTQRNDWSVIGPNIEKSKSAKVDCICKCGTRAMVLCRRLEDGSAKGCRKCHPVNGKHSHWFRGAGEISISYLKRLVENASARGLAIEVSATDIWNQFVLQNAKCALSGDDINFGIHTKLQTKLQSQTASLDRINSNLGYVKGNIQWVHKDVNRMKNAFSEQYFITTCQKIANYAENKRENSI